MEPGHEDREYAIRSLSCTKNWRPQWSPVMKTGNTGNPWAGSPYGNDASMEPGHEDREYEKE